MNKPDKVILIHGNGGGTKDDHWLPYVKRELEKLGLEVVAVTFPDNVEAKSSIWLPYLEKELKADGQTIIIGHSSGAVAAMRYAETHRIFGSVLVGGCYTDLGWASEKISGYYDQPWQWDKIRENQNWIIQFASKDDPYIPITEERHIHENLDTEYYEFSDKGHFGSVNPEEGINNPMPEFPELAEAVKRRLAIES